MSRYEAREKFQPGWHVYDTTAESIVCQSHDHRDAEKTASLLNAARAVAADEIGALCRAELLAMGATCHAAMRQLHEAQTALTAEAVAAAFHAGSEARAAQVAEFLDRVHDSEDPDAFDLREAARRLSALPLPEPPT